MSRPLRAQTTHQPTVAEGDCGDATPAPPPRGPDTAPLQLACLKPGVRPRPKHRVRDLHGGNEIIIYRITLSQRHITYPL